MPYTELLRRALQIAWRHRWLWLLALFGGELGGGLSNGFSGRAPTPTGLTNGPPGQQLQLQDATGWLQAHAALLVGAFLVVLLLWVALFLLSCACAAATVKGVQEIDAAGSAGLGRAWALGRARFFPVLRLRLIVLLAWLAVLAFFALLAAAGIFLFIAQSWGGLAVVIALGISLGFTALLFGLVLSVLTPVALRAAVIDDEGGWGAWQRAYGITMARTGRVLACWGLMFACQFLYGLGAAFVATAVGIPAGLAIYGAYAAGQLAAAIVGGVLLAVILGGVLIVAGAAFAAFYSAFWTLCFPRLRAA